MKSKGLEAATRIPLTKADYSCSFSPAGMPRVLSWSRLMTNQYRSRQKKLMAMAPTTAQVCVILTGQVPKKAFYFFSNARLSSFNVGSCRFSCYRQVELNSRGFEALSDSRTVFPTSAMIKSGEILEIVYSVVENDLSWSPGNLNWEGMSLILPRIPDGTRACLRCSMRQVTRSAPSTLPSPSIRSSIISRQPFDSLLWFINLGSKH